MTDVADAGADRDADGQGDASDEGSPPPEGAGADELVARVAAADVEAAAAVEDLRRRVAELETELADRDETIDELESKVKRARADFQNYKKRAKQREEELRERATEDLVERLLDVRDNLVRALEQDDDVEVRDGVEATLSTFDRVLDGENVSAIEPEAGQAADPERHEVVHRTEADPPEGTIIEVYRPGYEMADRVLRPAQVTVSAGAEDQDGGGAQDGGESDGAGADDGEAGRGEGTSTE